MTLPPKTWKDIFDELIEINKVNKNLTWSEFIKNNDLPVSLNIPSSTINSSTLEKEQLNHIKALETMIRQYDIPYSWKSGIKQRIAEIFSQLDKLRPWVQ